MPIVHIICATLREDAPAEAVAHALALAGELARAEGARHTVAGRSGERLVAVTWLAGRDALEPFAASPAHMSFVMRGLAPCIRGLWSAAVESDGAPPPAVGAVWVFALQAAESLYEWQVRDFLGAVAALPGVVTAGATVEERERYRAGGAVCIGPGAVPAFRAALEAARRGWGDIDGALVEALVDVVTAEAGGDRDA